MKFSNRCGQILMAGCLLLLLHQNQCFVQAYFESEQIEQKYETVDESDTLQALSNDQSTSQIQQQQQQQQLQSQQQSSQLQHQIQQQQQQQQQSQLILDQQQSASNSDNEQIAQNVVQIQQQQQPQHQSQLANTISTSDQNRLNEIYNRLASQAIPKSFRQQEQESELSSASSYQSAHSLQSASLSSIGNDETQSSSSSEYGMYQPIQHGGGFGGGLSKITQIPQGSMFAFPDKNGKLEFESMYAKQPYSIVFRTQSMPVKIKQQHQTLPAPEVEFVRSQEEAHRIKHEVIRPVIQEVHEIIQPYRRVIQEVRPVIENVHTIVAKGEPRGSGGAGGGGGGGSGLGGGLGLKGAGIGRGGGGGYPDNLSGSYSENRAVKFIPINEQEQTTQPRSTTHYQQQQHQPQPASTVHREAIHPQQQFHQRSFRSHLTESSSLRPKSGRYSSTQQQRRF